MWLNNHGKIPCRRGFPYSACVRGDNGLIPNAPIKDAIQIASTNPARMFSLKELGEIGSKEESRSNSFSVGDNKVIIKKHCCPANWVLERLIIASSGF